MKHWWNYNKERNINISVRQNVSQTVTDPPKSYTLFRSGLDSVFQCVPKVLDGDKVRTQTGNVLPLQTGKPFPNDAGSVCWGNSHVQTEKRAQTVGLKSPLMEEKELWPDHEKVQKSQNMWTTKGKTYSVTLRLSWIFWCSSPGRVNKVSELWAAHLSQTRQSQSSPARCPYYTCRHLLPPPPPSTSCSLTDNGVLLLMISNQ